MLNIFIASDHAGFALKGVLVEYVRGLGYEIEDLGAASFNADDDYPDFVTPLAKRIASESGSLGIIIGGSGQGEAMCANRVPGIRAAVFYVIAASTAMVSNPAASSASAEVADDSAPGAKSADIYEIVRLARQHNNANVLSIGARFVADEVAREAVRIFLETTFSEAPRHIRRITKF
ncbi:MAG: RpiB/LacA/LacB family sugar-phosphate isomerase [bacterium]|nr:RpiB/LacA/LacB family sugar-phosphate isomerase [bacterium]MDO8741933.1 RpiB/LacA/LacB family sugar-phosphate isomerase [bacterium]